MTRSYISQIDFLIYTGQIIPFCIKCGTFRKSAKEKIIVEFAQYFGFLLRSYKGHRGQFDVIGCKIFFEIVRVYVYGYISSTESSLYISAKHFCITAGDVYSMFSVCHTTCKLIPTCDILYFIKKQYRSFAIHLKMNFKQQV